MSKIAFFYSFNPSSWISCQKIVFNLLKSYQTISGDEHKYYHFNDDTDPGTILSQVKELKDWGAEKIVLLDHKPHPLPVLNFLHQEYLMNSEKPELIIHIYGDFSLHYRQWSMAQSLLTNWKVKWFCASERQANYFKPLLNDPSSVDVCPFPIESNPYSYQKSIRDEQRKEWKVTDDQKVLIYTGRLSLQKRIHTLIKYFAMVKKDHPNYRLHIYGEFDNIADPFFGIWQPEGKYFSDIMRLVASLPENVQKDIYWFGGVSNNDLPRAYHGADLLVSFSVHHDEDYGMTVAEALSCGLPCLLSDWAGYASFKLKGIEDWVHLVKVSLRKSGRLLSTKEIKESLTELVPTLSHAPRETISKVGLDYFSISSCSKKITDHLKHPAKKFTGFSPLFEKINIAHVNFNNPYVYPHPMRFNKLYKEIYHPYVRTN